MDKLPEIIIGGRNIPLYYSTYETIAIQREIGCTAFQLNDMVFGVEKIDEEKGNELGNIRLTVTKKPEMQERLGTLIKILGNAGLEESGQEPDLDTKWILRNMKPAMVAVYAMLVLSVITAGNIMEAKEEQTGPVNEVTEEIEAKKQPGN